MPGSESVHKGSRGFTLVELLIVIGVIVVLIALLLPSVASVRARARTAQCQSNLAQLGLGIQSANRNRSTPVTAVDANGNRWTAQIEPFLEGEDAELFVCPADFDAANRNEAQQDPADPAFRGSFAVNSRVHQMQGSDANKITVLDFGDGDGDGENDSVVHVVVPEGETDTNWATNVNGQQAFNAGVDEAGSRHSGIVNSLRHDGSVSAESADDLVQNHPAQQGSDAWVAWRSEGDPNVTLWDAPASENGDIDTDGDGIANDEDNCPDTPNPNQADGDGDGVGDACNTDDPDGDGIGSAEDNCPNNYNPGQEDDDGDGTGNVCDFGDSADDGESGGEESTPPEDSTPLEDEGCYDPALGFPEVANFHVRSIHGSGDVGPIRLDPNHFRFQFISMDDCNNYELWYEDWSDWDYDMHFRFQRILTGYDAGKIRLSVKFVTPAYAHYYLFLDGNGTPLPGNLTHYCNSSGYQTCGDNETFIPTNVWLESTELIDGFLDRPCACPPAVDAGADVSFAYPKLDYQLLGDASIDSSTGLPSEVMWSQASGPAGVTFSDPTVLQPTATFPGEGVYVLKLTGTAGGGNSSDEVQITVLPEGSTLYRYVRIKRVSGFGPLFLANVEIVNTEGVNVAPMGMASAANGWNEEYAITNAGCESTACYQSQTTPDSWWMVEFGEASTIDSIEIKNTCTNGFGQFLNGVEVEALDENQTKIWSSQVIADASDGSTHSFNP